MKIEEYRSNERGVTELGWLHSQHSFSFGHYYDPKRVGFGMLRVLNEDIVEPGMGFGAHPHDNMEIVSIVLEGTLEHKDSEGNHGLIPAGDVQKMSAGRGITHSEYNHSKKDIVHFLQIWVHPKEHNSKPGYEQKSFAPAARKNKLQPIVSGVKNKETLYIHQEAAFFLGSFDAGVKTAHRFSSPNHGVFIFVIKGAIRLDGRILNDGDAAAVTEAAEINLTADKKTDLLVIEVALNH